MNKLTVVTSAFALFLYTISSTTIFQAAAQSAAAHEPIQAGHTHDVIRVKWSPDDERFISYSGGDDCIRLWEVKMALGAQSGNVLRLVIGQGMKLAFVGVATGFVASLALTRTMKNLLFGVSATDPTTFATIALLLISVALLAC